MRFWNRDNEGYTRGGMDVTTAINLFFKGLLISPILLLALYITLAMLKHMIFHGVPSMNRPTTEQVDQLRERDQHINQMPPAPAPVAEPEPVKEEVILPPVTESKSAMDRVMNPAELNTPVPSPAGVPFTIYDGPNYSEGRYKL